MGTVDGMGTLIDGIFQFQNNEVKPKLKYYNDLAKGQSPKALFITCSDSRINPHLLTQTKPGELFVLRNAGNIVPAHGTSAGGEAGTIEYAISALGINNIIICGHSHCGAMKGLLHPESLTDLPAVSDWIKHAEATRHVLKHKCNHLNDDTLVTEAAKENVLVQLNNLRTLPAVSARLATGKIQLHGWVYMIESGEVMSYDDRQTQFYPLNNELSLVESRIN